ncbi:MAG: LTA synthase family protein [Clostridia bacterium]|nr:LTA synthase family protein [Clostridia bacterium]
MKIRLIERRKGEKRAPLPVRILGCCLVLVMLILTMGCIWAVRSYDNISLEEVLFYLSMPLQGTSREFTRSIILNVFLPAGLLFCLFLAALVLPLKKEICLETKSGHRLHLLPLRIPAAAGFGVLLIWMAVIFPAGDRLLGIREFISSRIHQSMLIEERYVDPAKTKITFPEKKRNLITIYVESAETTNQDVANGGQMKENYIPEMTQLMRENLTFSQSELFEGAAVAPACGWTIAGLIAQTAGLPLKLFKYDDMSTDNMGYDIAEFLPGATMLGDILNDEGYRTVFACGSDFDFGGRRRMYNQHGAYEIDDYYRAIEAGVAPEGYYYGWGIEDWRLYEYAKMLLLELQEGDQPFHLGLLTADTHDPGWLCEYCPKDTGNILGRTIRCSSKQVYRFIEWCRQQDFYENTTIVVTGDHANMARGFYEEATDYDKHNGNADRFVYNVFINSVAEPVQTQNRKFTTLDFFPTVMAAMGCEIEGNRLGLGTNLFSGEQTLSEEMGYETFFTELNKKSLFYDSKLMRN